MTRIEPHFWHCGGPYELTEANFTTGWHTSPTTLDEQAIAVLFRKRPSLFVGKLVLHVGIGNSSLFREFGNKMAAFTGLTIGMPEKLYFQSEFADAPNATVIFANKHDPGTFKTIGGKFDLIIDVNLKSFACCEEHFHRTFSFYVERLRPTGVILTAASGLRFGWSGNTSKAYTPGASSDSAAQIWRVLGEEGLRALSERHGLVLESHELRSVPNWHGQGDCSRLPAKNDETLWLLRKKCG